MATLIEKSPFIVRRYIFKKRYCVFTTLWEVIKDSSSFITSSLFSSLALLLITVIIALHKFNGAFATTSISYITIFQFSFIQLGGNLGVVLALWAKRLYDGSKHKFVPAHQTVNLASFYAFTFGLVMSGVYLASAYTYNLYANIHQNTLFAQLFGEQYLWSSLALVVLAPVHNYFLISIWSNDRRKILFTIILDFATWTTCLVTSFLLGKYSVLAYNGYGLGLSIGYIAWTIIISFIKFHKEWKINNFGLSLNLLKITIKQIWSQTVLSVFASVAKMFVLLALYHLINQKMVGSVPLNLQSSRILWYQSMLFIQGFGFGFADYLFYVFQKQMIRDRRYHSRQLFICIFSLLFIYSMIAAIIFGFSIKPLSAVYAKEQNQAYIHLESKIPEHFYASIRLKMLENPKLVYLLGQKAHINPKLILAHLASNDPKVWKIVIEQLITPIWRAGPNFQYLYGIPNPITKSFVSISAEGIEKLLTGDNTYIHLAIFGIFYSLSSSLMRYYNLITRRLDLPFVSLIFQILVIAFVVGFGVDYQNGTKFAGLLAWSMPMSISSAVILIFSLFIFTTTYSKFLSTYSYKDNNFENPYPFKWIRHIL